MTGIFSGTPSWLLLLVAAALVLGISLVLKRAMRRVQRPVTGGLYAIKNDDGTYSVAKVLKVDDCAVHLCIYSNIFPAVPNSIDPSTLSLDGVSQEDTKQGEELSFGVEHVPIGTHDFQNATPIFLMHTAVTDEELEGYNEWKNDTEGGVFTDLENSR